MKFVKFFVGLMLFVGVLRAQSPDPYLDDTYMTKAEIKYSQAKAKAEAQARYEARRLAEAEAEAEQQKLIEAYKKRQRELEIDAYNGRLSAKDSLDLQRAYAQEYARAKRDYRTDEAREQAYGPYSSRLSRFHGDGRLGMYVDDLYDYSTYSPVRASVYLGIGVPYPWYDGFYSIYRHSPWGYTYGRYMWDYPYYDPYFVYHSPWVSPYYGIGYYGRLHDAYWSSYSYGYASRRYNHYYRNEYSGAARNAQTSRYVSPYEAYRSAGASYRSNSSSVGRYSERAGYAGQTSYTGRGRSTFNTQGASYERSNEARSSSYNGGFSSDNSSQRSSGASSARARRGR